MVFVPPFISTKTRRDLAKKYHPDLNKDDKTAIDKFKELNEAYEVLSDDKKKQQYDMFGNVDDSGGDNPFQRGNPFAGGPFGGFSYSSGSNPDVEELLSEFFNFRPRPPSKGKDVTMSVRLSFLEAVHGVTKDIKYEYLQRSEGISRILLLLNSSS